MSKDYTKSELLIRKLANSKLLAFPIAIGIIFLALVSISEGIQKSGDIFGKAFGQAQAESLFDSQTKEGLLSIARRMDEFLLLVDSDHYLDSNKSTWFTQYVSIKADLNSLLLRNRVRPSNDESISQLNKISEIWDSVASDLIPDWREEYGAAYFREFRKVTLLAIEICLKTEEEKKDTSDKDPTSPSSETSLTGRS